MVSEILKTTKQSDDLIYNLLEGEDEIHFEELDEDLDLTINWNHIMFHFVKLSFKVVSFVKYFPFLQTYQYYYYYRYFSIKNKLKDNTILLLPHELVLFYVQIHLNKKQMYLSLLDDGKKPLISISVGVILHYHGLFAKIFKKNIKSYILFFKIAQVLIKECVGDYGYSLNLIGYNYRMQKFFIFLDKNFKLENMKYLCYLPKVPYAPLKNKKIKSIKRRLLKKILKNFVKIRKNIN